MGRGITAKQSGKHGTASGLALVAAEQARPVERPASFDRKHHQYQRVKSLGED
jgi:hypothetical protein